MDPSKRFYRGSRNALGHEETFLFEPIRGQVVSQTGPNGRTTYFEYDAMGRPVKTISPNQTTTSTSHAFDSSVTVTDAVTGFTHRSAYRITSTTTGLPLSMTWYNAQQQPIRSAKEDFNGNLVFNDSTYNSGNRTILINTDYTAVSENYYAGNTPLWTRSVHDAIGRPHELIAPDGSKKSKRLSPSFHDFR